MSTPMGLDLPRFIRRCYSRTPPRYLSTMFFKRWTRKSTLDSMATPIKVEPKDIPDAADFDMSSAAMQSREPNNLTNHIKDEAPARSERMSRYKRRSERANERDALLASEEESRPAKPAKKRRKAVAKAPREEASNDEDEDKQPRSKKKKIRSETSSTQQQQSRTKPIWILAGDGSYCCRICHKFYADKRRANAHYRSVHRPSDKFPCGSCGRKFRSRYLCTAHEKVHRELSNDSSYWCDKCGYRSRTKEQLQMHALRLHSDEASYECDVCKKRFKVKGDLSGHLGMVHAREFATEEYMCDICGRIYYSQHTLKKHRRVTHVNRYNYQCGVCKVRLLTEDNLRLHVRKHHERPLECEQCGLEFQRKRALNRHRKHVHSESKNNLCQVCGKAFVCSSALRVHYLIHAKLKPYICNICGSRFTQRSSLMLHWRKKHPDAGEAPPKVQLANVYDGFQRQLERVTDVPAEVLN